MKSDGFVKPDGLVKSDGFVKPDGFVKLNGLVKPDRLVKPVDLLVLGGESGGDLASEARELVERVFRCGRQFPGPGVLRLEPPDPGFAGGRGCRCPAAGA
ncbi:hypothetical protein ACIGJO_32065 [Streptomyces sp. NPDC079020]|uniref:hypothetical protein n=1 Tax=Streptomyces sp. NPDC079020 TaxID=3365722 RepID=UPI0037D56A2F